MQTRELFYISDDTHLTSSPSLARTLGATALPLKDAAARGIGPDSDVIVDVNTTDLEVVRSLKWLFGKAGKGFRLFLVDHQDRVSMVHADVLGSTCSVSKTSSATKIQEALEKRFGKSRTTVVEASIGAGVDAIEDSFSALSEGKSLNSAQVIAAGEKIADAVCIDGVHAWLDVVKQHQEGTFQHCMLVTGIVSAFASQLGMPRADVIRMTVAGLLHDIGKANVSVAILDKPGALTLREMDAMRTHPVSGYNYLVEHSSMDAEILGAVRGHHEYLDGSGYPDNMEGHYIIEMTRILTVCDIYAALVEQRNYKEPKSHMEAMTILNGMCGKAKLDDRFVAGIDRLMSD